MSRLRHGAGSLITQVVILLVASSAVAKDAWTRSDNSIVENRMIIAYNENSDDHTRSSIRSGFGVRSARTLTRSGDLEVIEVWDGLPLKELARAIAAEPYVAFVEPDYKVSTAGVTNDPDIDRLYAMTITKTLQAWELVSDVFGDLQETVVGVIDTGVDYNHPDLKDNMWVNQLEKDGRAGFDDDGNGYIDDVYGINVISGTGDPMDDNMHGTHCAGTIAAKGDNLEGVIGAAGPQNKVKLMACKFLDRFGSGSLSGAIECLEYAMQMNATMTSNSWGGGGFSLALSRVIDQVQDTGQLLVAAAGNSRNNNDVVPTQPASMPQDIIMAVASSTADDARSWFSNYGEHTVDIAAPGSDIYSTMPGEKYGTLSGTSMATPFVSGIAALLKAAEPNLSALDIKKLLMDTANKKTSLATGFTKSGRIDALAAVQALKDQLPSEPEPEKFLKSMSSPAQFFSTREVPQASPSFDLEGISLKFKSPKAKRLKGYEIICSDGISRLPVRPRKKYDTHLNLGDDDSVEVPFENDFVFTFFGVDYSSVFVSSNGCLTFGAADSSYFTDPAIHFNLPRISVLFSDLDPSLGGEVTFRQKGGKRPSVTVTWKNVPFAGETQGNSFQVTLTNNNAIKMAYSDISAEDVTSAMVGVSPGQRFAMERVWKDTDFTSSRGKC